MGRVAAVVALGAGVLVIALVLLGGGDTYKVNAQFENASQLVNGNQVKVAGVPAGTINGISLGEDGTAIVEMEVDSDYAPLHEGTVATIRSQSLSGIANRFISLQMPTAGQRGPAIRDGGTLPISSTVSEARVRRREGPAGLRRSLIAAPAPGPEKIPA